MMHKPLVAAALSMALPALVAAQAPLTVGTIQFSPVSNLAEIKVDDLKGQPSRLAWSADGQQLYLQTMDGKFGQPDAKLHHYVYDAATGNRKGIDATPEWAAAYWTDKSGQSAPGAPAFKIQLKSDTRVEKTVSAPMGGDLAKGGGVGADGGAASSGDAMAAAYNQQPVPVHTMLLSGQVVGEFVNSVTVPGLTFGWGPKGSNVIAYSANKSGRVVIMDDKGTRQEIAGSKDAILPAWSPDGRLLTWLEKDGKKKFVLKLTKIG